MRQYRLRNAVAIVAIIAISLSVGGYLERVKERSRQAAMAKALQAARRNQVFTLHMGAFW